MGKPRKLKNKESFFVKIRKRIAFQLLFWFLVIEFPVQCVLVYVSYWNARSIIQEESINNLSAISERQVKAINIFFQQALKDVELLASTPDMYKTTYDYQTLRDTSSIEKEAKFDSLHRGFLMKYQETFDFDDLWVVSPTGKVQFASVEQGMKGEMLQSKKWQNTTVGRVFERANILLQADFSDFSLNTKNRGALYIASPIRNAQKRFVGVLIVQINNQNIEKAINDYTGLGETGESILLTKFKEEALFVNNTRHAPDAAFKKTISLNQDANQIIAESLKGKNGSGMMIDYRGEEVLAKWVYVPSLRSALIVKLDTEEAFSSVQVLRNILFVIVLVTLTLVILAAFSVAESFSRPIRKLTLFTRQVALGKLDEQVNIASTNEIGELADSFNQMVNNLQKSRDELQDYAQNLEQKVAERTEELQAMNEEINQSNEELSSTLDFVNRQKAEIEKNNNDMLSSLNYAKRIQEAYLPSSEKIAYLFSDYFVMLKPRDIVSGDFYWYHQINPDEGILAVGDCTGHGVPGAFMSILGNDILNSIVIQDGCIEVDLILNNLHNGIRKSLRQKETGSKDGMDITIIKVDLKGRVLHFAGAQNPMVLIQDERKYFIRGSKMGIGGVQREKERIFEKHTFPLISDTIIYLYSDGYQDQFGGLDNRKFLGKRFRELLYEIHTKPMNEQKDVLDQTFKDWKQAHKQLDDVLVVGVKIEI
jgi:serine phosphatase RsbU (regulator of sigma subunit)